LLFCQKVWGNGYVSV